MNMNKGPNKSFASDDSPEATRQLSIVLHVLRVCHLFLFILKM